MTGKVKKLRKWSDIPRDEQKRITDYYPRRDTDERLALWSMYGDETRCCGGHLLQRGYCCPWCDSVDPSNECHREGVKRE